MHIEPGVLDGIKFVLSYGTAAAAGAYAVKCGWDAAAEHGIASLALRTIAATGLVFAFFEVLPHYPVGVSEVHFILGSTLFLLFGVAPAAFGLAMGLFIQGAVFAPGDLPQFFVNVTTLLVPLFAIEALAQRIIPPHTPYVELKYRHALALSTAYQGGVVAWVAFWVLYGGGLGAENLGAVLLFGVAYMLVIIVEPIVDLAVLALAKVLRNLSDYGLFTGRLHNPA
ncbi:MAG: energy-coupling factor ABC transporter permease [Pseudomonadota bacterium]